jgi:hypothetical protein
MQNATTAPVTFTVTSASQPGAGVSYAVLPGYLVTNIFPGAVDSEGWYSFAAAASTDPTFLRQFSGDEDTSELQFTTNAPPVVSNTEPVVTLIGANPLTNDCHAAFTDPGATVSDTGADKAGNGHCFTKRIGSVLQQNYLSPNRRELARPYPKQGE